MAKKSKILAFIQGEWFGLGAYKRRGIEIGAVVLLFLFYIWCKFTVQTKLDTIISLRRDLTNAKTEMVSVSSKYGSIIRESELTRRVDSLHLDLKVADQPPYDLDKTNEKVSGDEHEGK